MIFVVVKDRRREREKKVGGGGVEMIEESDIDVCCSC